MKNTIIILSSLFLVLLGTAQIQAQENITNENNYLVLSKNIKQLQPILMTASDLEKEDEEKYGGLTVVFCGKTVTDIEHNTAFYTLLENAKKQGIKVFVCGISLNSFNINADQIPDNLEVVDNGILFGFQLKKQGYITLTI